MHTGGVKAKVECSKSGPVKVKANVRKPTPSLPISQQVEPPQSSIWERGKAKLKSQLHKLQKQSFLANLGKTAGHQAFTSLPGNLGALVSESQASQVMGRNFVSGHSLGSGRNWCLESAAGLEQGMGHSLVGGIEPGALVGKALVQQWEQAANAGDLQAQYRLGDIFYYGQYQVAMDETLAFKWYELAAQQGLAEAQFALAFMWEQGQGTGQDYPEAVKWYAAAAEQGYALAQNSLGDMYFYGHGVKQDYSMAVKWYTAAAHNKLTLAQNNLGYMYEKGYGIARDFQKAMFWYKTAAKHGNADAMYNVGMLYYQGWVRAEDSALGPALRELERGKLGELCTAGEVSSEHSELGLEHGEFGPEHYEAGLEADGDDEAVKWFEQAAQLEQRQAQNILGVLYFYGRGVPQSMAEALKWFKLSAANGDDVGQKNLGLMFANGYGVAQDLFQALACYEAAGSQGNVVALDLLGDVYYYGKGEITPGNWQQAAYWYGLAANLNDAYAQCCLGFMYEHGQGVAQDDKEALKWYTAAAEQELPEAQMHLAHMLDLGKGTTQDPLAAFIWYKAAAEQGSAPAQYNLGWCYELGRGVPQDYELAAQCYASALQGGLTLAQEQLNRVQAKLQLNGK